MTLLVTGAMGHVGLEIVRKLAPHRKVLGHYNRTFRPRDAEELGPNVTWLSCDLTDREAVDRLCEDLEVDACIHLAAIANEAFARPDPAAAFRVNVGAVVNLLDAARRHGWRRFVNCSTGSVFKTVDPEREIMESRSVDAESIYGSTKGCAELMTTAFRAQYSISAASVRLSRIYGPPVKDGSIARGLIPEILINAMKRKPRHDASGGDFQGGFTYIEDVVDGLIAAVDAPEFNFAAYHLAPPRNYSVFEIAEVVRALVPGADIEIGPGTEPWDRFTPMRGRMNGERFFADTGFRTRFSLKQGLAAYHAWLRRELDIEA
jgi:nucleoside-diphosphate-sugar epimerase